MLRKLLDLWHGPKPDMHLTLAYYQHHHPSYLRRPVGRPANYAELAKLRSSEVRQQAISEASTACALHEAGYNVPDYVVLMAMQLLKETGMWRG